MLNKLIGKLREFKPGYILYNFLHRKKLSHNRELYRRWQVKKPLYWSVSSVDFAALPQQSPWLDQPEAGERVQADENFKKLPDATQQQILQWINDGAIIIKNFLTPEEADAVTEETERLLKQKILKPLDNGKIMFAFRYSELIKKLVHDERITGLFSFILQQPVVPFQTINFIKGSEQKAHSDSIHMTTYPLGYLAAAWVALEDVDDENGSLFYYPGSHKLPYILSPDFDNKTNTLRLDPDTNQQYEKKIEEIIQQRQLRKINFNAKKGDLFLWHANLLHGGNKIVNKERTRKSMVVHYFGRDVIKYHEISHRPALIEE